MFSTQLVAGPAYLVIATLIGMVVLVVGEADRIENQMVVNMSLVNMGGKYKLVLATQYFFAICIPISWASSAETSPGSKAWIRWRPRVLALVDGMAACPFKFNVGGFTQHNQKRGYQQFSICLIGITDIVNSSFQR